MKKSMNEKTKRYFEINNPKDQDEFIKELKLYCRLDLGIPTKEVNKMSLDQIVEAVIKDHDDNPIMGS